MSARCRTPDAPCARFYNKEERWARRQTRRTERRAVRTWIAQERFFVVPAPVIPKTCGWMTW